MKVSELRAQLEEMPQDAEVLIVDRRDIGVIAYTPLGATSRPTETVPFVTIDCRGPDFDHQHMDWFAARLARAAREKPA